MPNIFVIWDIVARMLIIFIILSSFPVLQIHFKLLELVIGHVVTNQCWKTAIGPLVAIYFYSGNNRSQNIQPSRPTKTCHVKSHAQVLFSFIFCAAETELCHCTCAISYACPTSAWMLVSVMHVLRQNGQLGGVSHIPFVMQIWHASLCFVGCWKALQVFAFVLW